MANNDFGELRQLLNQPKLDRKSFWSLVETKANESPEVYFDQWLPYIQSFPHHFEGIYEYCLSMTLIERYVRVLPHLFFGFASNHLSALGSGGTQVLANNPVLAHVKALDLTRNHIGTRGLKALMNSVYIEQIEWMRLSKNAISDRGVGDIATSTHLAVLQHLMLDGNQCTEVGLVELAQSEQLTMLKTLSFAQNTLGIEYLEASTDTRGFPSLSFLNLSCCGISDDILACLSQSEFMRGVAELELTDNAISRLDQLSQGDTLSDLAMLNMARCRLDDAGFIAWCDSSWTGKLETLSVSENALGDASLQKLAHCPAGMFLKSLDFGYTNISDEGVKSLASATALGQLELLFLEDIELSQDTINALVSSQSLPSLQTICYGDERWHHVGDSV